MPYHKLLLIISTWKFMERRRMKRAQWESWEVEVTKSLTPPLARTGCAVRDLGQRGSVTLGNENENLFEAVS